MHVATHLTSCYANGECVYIYRASFSIEQSLIIIPNACHSFIRHIRSTEFDITHALFRAHQQLILPFFSHTHICILLFQFSTFSIHVLLFHNFFFLAVCFYSPMHLPCYMAVAFFCVCAVFSKNAYQYVTLFRI